MSDPPSANYDWFGWSLDAGRTDVQLGRLVETHEHFHRQLDDTSAFGGLVTTVAALADGTGDPHWLELRDRLKSMSDLVHECYAVGLSLICTQRPVAPVSGYPMYDWHVRTLNRLIGVDIHPWVAMGAVRAALFASMQSTALRTSTRIGLAHFEASELELMERPNHRLAALLASDFAEQVREFELEAERKFNREPWWRPEGGLLIGPEAVDGAAGVELENLRKGLFSHAAQTLQESDIETFPDDAHHRDLRELLRQAFALAPDGLPRIGAIAEDTSDSGQLDLSALDGQTVRLPVAPERATVLPYGTASGLGGEGESRHGFVAVTTTERIELNFTLSGVELPDSEVVACMRATVFDGEERDSILLLPISDPSQVNEEHPVFVSAYSSAKASDSETVDSWLAWATPARSSIVMDTPFMAPLRRWVAEGARFRTQTRVLEVEGVEIRVIAGRIEDGGRQSPLIIVPTTEFGARWFEAACGEDPELSKHVVEDPSFFEKDSDHLDVVITHLLFEERYVGTGSWRK